MSDASEKKIRIKAPSPAEYRAYLAKGRTVAEPSVTEAFNQGANDDASLEYFVGQYEPKDRDGNSLGRIFNVFAAPQDLPGTMKYVDAVKYIAELKNWNGHDGTNYATDEEFYRAIKSGSYDGGWIIPTRDILRGNDVDGKETTPDNLYAHKDRGALKGTFCMAASAAAGPNWYWSSTEHRDDPSCVHFVRFSDGSEDWYLKDIMRLSCRPVRLVEVKR